MLVLLTVSLSKISWWNGKSADCDQGLHWLLKHLCPLVSDNYLRNRLIWINIIRYHLLLIDIAEIYTIAHAENLYNCNSWTVACNRLQHRAPDINGCFWWFFFWDTCNYINPPQKHVVIPLILQLCYCLLPNWHLEMVTWRTCTSVKGKTQFLSIIW